MKVRWIAMALTLGGLALQGQAPAATVDLTGYWVSLVTEDWRYRMLNAPKGDYYSLPLNAEGKRVADTWDPAKDIAEGKQCLSYGAPNIMREPGRVHITWANDHTLKVEIDAGKQTRLFLFGQAPTPLSRLCRELRALNGRPRSRSGPILPRSRRKIPTRRDSRPPAWLRLRRLRTLAVWEAR